MGKGALPADHRLHLGVAGVWGEYPATEAVRNADVILAIGARFNDLHTGSWIPGYVYNIPPTRLIQVDIDPEEIGRNYPVEIGMVGDAKAFLAQAVRIARAKGLRGGYGGSWQLANRLAQFLRTVRALRRRADRAAPHDGGDEQDFPA
jgi:acetolactate synthase-1/2/3 large subunit